MPFRSLAADDIFISYTRLDASTYAAGLADELTKKGFSCFIDKLGTDPNKDLPDMLRRKVKSCAMLVVVGTERAATRKTIADEIGEFVQTGRGSSIVPIDFDGAVYRAEWYPLVEGIAPEPEKNALALDNGEPSLSVLSRIEKQFNYTRRNQRLRRAALGMAIVFALLLLAGVGAGVYARQQIILANTERKQALEQRAAADKARNEAATERGKADQAKKDADLERAKAAELKTKADEAEVRAGEAARREQVARNLEAQAKANAHMQQVIASSRSKANSAMRYGAAMPDQALNESVEAYRIHPTVEARSSLLASLEQYPNLIGVGRETPNPIDSLASCHNGAVLVSADDAGLVLFWDASHKRVFKRIEPPAKKKNYRTGVVCTPAGSLCAADFLGGALIVWEVKERDGSYEVIERLSIESPTFLNSPVPLTPVFATPDLLVAIEEGRHGTRRQKVALVNLAHAAPTPDLKTLTLPPDVTSDEFGAARSLTANLATRTIAIGFNRGVALWQIDSLDKPAVWIRYPQEWKEHITENLVFSSDGKFLAVSVDAGQVGVWDLSEDVPELKKISEPGAGSYIAFFNDSLKRRETPYLMTAKRNGEISFWDIWNQPAWVKSFKPGISALVPAGDTGIVAMGSSDGLVASWDMGRVSSLRQSLRNNLEYPRAFAFGRSSGLLYVATGTEGRGDTGSKLWRENRGRYELLAPGERRPEFPAGEFGLKLLPDTSRDHITLRDAYDGRTNEIRVPIKHTPSAPRTVSSDGRVLAIGDSGTDNWNNTQL